MDKDAVRRIAAHWGLPDMNEDEIHEEWQRIEATFWECCRGLGVADWEIDLHPAANDPRALLRRIREEVDAHFGDRRNGAQIPDGI